MVGKRNAENKTASQEAARNDHHGVVKVLAIEDPPMPVLLNSRPRLLGANATVIRQHLGKYALPAMLLLFLSFSIF